MVIVDRWFGKETKTSTTQMTSTTTPVEKRHSLLSNYTKSMGTCHNLSLQYAHKTITATPLQQVIETKYLWNFNQKTGNPTDPWLVFSFFLTQISEPYPLKRKLLCAKAARDFDPLYISWQSWPCCLKTRSVSLWKLWNGTAVLKWIHHWI